MPGDRIAAAPLDVPQGALETLVGERLDPTAVVADDVVVVLACIAHGLEARDAVPKVDPLHEPLLGEHLEDAVDARQPDTLPASDQLAVELLRANAAVLSFEELDHEPSRRAAAITGRLQLGHSALCPEVLAHA